jgi:hypothetical protein
MGIIVNMVENGGANKGAKSTKDFSQCPLWLCPKVQRFQEFLSEWDTF